VGNPGGDRRGAVADPVAHAGALRIGGTVRLACCLDRRVRNGGGERLPGIERLASAERVRASVEPVPSIETVRGGIGIALLT